MTATAPVPHIFNTPQTQDGENDLRQQRGRLVVTAKTALGPIGPQTKVSSVLHEGLLLPPGDTARDPSARPDDFPWSNARIAYPLEIYPSAEYRFAATRRFRLDEVGCTSRMRRGTLESLKRRIQSDANLSSGYTTDSDGAMRHEASFAGETPGDLAALPGRQIIRTLPDWMTLRLARTVTTAARFSAGGAGPQTRAE